MWDVFDYRKWKDLLRQRGMFEKTARVDNPNGCFSC